jgi:hypothetical protein
LNRVLCLGGGDQRLQFWHAKGTLTYNNAVGGNEKLLLQWTPSDVSGWAAMNGYGEASSALLSNDIDGNLLFELNGKEIQYDF